MAASDSAQQRGCDLIFTEVKVIIKGKEILQGVSGSAQPGQLVAIMGPSGKCHAVYSRSGASLFTIEAINQLLKV